MSKSVKMPASIVHSKSAQYGPVCPLRVARELQSWGVLGNYHLLLAHDVVKDPKGYAEVYDDPNNFIIMDNSAAELKAPVDLEMLLEAGHAVNADCLVLPDFLLQKDATIKGHLDAVSTLEGRWANDYMALPQGETFHDWVSCVNELVWALPKKARYFGIPRNVKEKLGTSRVEAVKAIYMLDPIQTRKYHLFGFSDDLWDDLAAAHMKYNGYGRIIGIDSAVPVRMGYNRVGLHPLQKDPGPRGDWWDNPGDFSPQVINNLTEMRAWLRGGRS